MRHLIKELQKKQRYLEQIQKDIQTSLQKISLQGTLVFRHRSGRLELSHNLGKGLPMRYLCLSNTDILTPLAQRRYYKEVLATITNMKCAVDKCIKILDDKEVLVDLAKIYENFPKELKPVIKPIEQLYDDYAKQWQARDYEKSRRPVGTNLRTKKGELVRSKSELIIANKLYDAGLPYHYETIFRTEQFIANPDFFILNPKTRKVFYWEHFGLMSKQDYLEDALYKIEGYAKYGVIQGDNLIVTYESVDHQLSTEYVDQLIERFLISG